jgi:hypothetical protein
MTVSGNLSPITMQSTLPTMDIPGRNGQETQTMEALHCESKKKNEWEWERNKYGYLMLYGQHRMEGKGIGEGKHVTLYVRRIMAHNCTAS